MASRADCLPLAGILLVCFAPSPSAQLSFVDVAPATGTTSLGWGRGAGMVDLDQDGLLDLIAINTQKTNAYFRQLPDHTFQEAHLLWGIPDPLLHDWALVAADFDNDADPDVFVARGGFKTLRPNQLLRNDIPQTGIMVDVSIPSGLGIGVSKSFGATALDYDLDGMLDLFVSNASSSPCFLYHNDGNLVFSDVSSAAGVDLIGNHLHCGAADFDRDGWPDVGVGGFGDANRLYHNQQNGTFVDVAVAAGVASTERDFGFVFHDFDNDGWFDVYLPRYNKLPGPPGEIHLNQGDGTFALAAVLQSTTEMGHNIHDLDSDGYAELYVGTGSQHIVDPDILYSVVPDGLGGLTVTDISASSGINVLGQTRCHGMAFGDYDQDGDIDAYVNNGGPQYDDTQQVNLLLQNQGNSNHWVSVGLQGVVSNRDGIGATVMARTSSGREVWDQRTAGKGFGNTSAPVVHLGLGSESLLERVQVRWPSGITQTLLAPPVDGSIHVQETGMRILGSPDIGTSVELQVIGNPGYAAELLYGPLPGTTPLPEFGGILALFPPFYMLGTLPIGAQGIGSMTIAIPSSPSLVGKDAHFQAWVHALDSLEESILTNSVTLTPQ